MNLFARGRKLNSMNGYVATVTLSAPFLGILGIVITKGIK